MNAFRPPLIPAYRQQFEEMMDDDFNTPRAIAILFDLAREVNSYLNSPGPLHQPFLQDVDQLFQDTAAGVLGLLPENFESQLGGQVKGDVEKIIQVVIDIRKKLRDQKQYQLADQLRADLAKVGILLVDNQKERLSNIKWISEWC